MSLLFIVGIGFAVITLITLIIVFWEPIIKFIGIVLGIALIVTIIIILSKIKI